MRDRRLYNIGLQVCGVTMLAALANGALGFIVGPSFPVFAVACVLAVIGLTGIALLAVGFYAGRQR